MRHIYFLFIFIFVTGVAPVAGATMTLCQRLLTERPRLNRPILPLDLKFQAWSPGSDLPERQQSLGALEFYSAQSGNIAVQSLSGVSELQSGEPRRRMNRLLELTPFVGIIDEAEFKSILDSQPIPERLKNELSAPGLTHIAKLLPDSYIQFNALTSAQSLREFLSREALQRLRQFLVSLEVVFDRLRFTVESPMLMVDENGRALLLNFENVRERNHKERRLRLDREKDIVEQALAGYD